MVQLSRTLGIWELKGYRAKLSWYDGLEEFYGWRIGKPRPCQAHPRSKNLWHRAASRMKIRRLATFTMIVIYFRDLRPFGIYWRKVFPCVTPATCFLQQHHKPLCRPELKTLTVSSLRGIRKQIMEHHYSLLRKSSLGLLLTIVQLQCQPNLHLSLPVKSLQVKSEGTAAGTSKIGPHSNVGVLSKSKGSIPEMTTTLPTDLITNHHLIQTRIHPNTKL